jgi:acyl-CoA thioesterase-1
MRLTLILLALLACIPSVFAAKTILVLGDSLSAGYGLRPEQAWPALLGQRLTQQRFDYNVANLSISGETTAGGRARLATALRQHKPDIVILALGANDGLRGLQLGQMRANLEAMIDASRQSGARVLLAGMRLPPNYGPYAEEFAQSFTQIARNRKVTLQPFLLEPVAAAPRYFLPDNLHPTAEAQPLILDHIWAPLAPLLK